MLPKIQYPVHTIIVPSTKKKVNFRPFLVKEEKILLMAKESEKDSDILMAVKQIVNNCSTDPKFDVNSLSIFDLEYIFLKLRAASVDNTIKISYKDLEDDKVYDFEIDLNEIEVTFPEKTDNNIKITQNAGILMKYPSANLYDDSEFLNLEKDQLFGLIIRCIDKIYQDDEVYDVKDYKVKDLSDFLENLSVKTFEDIQKFLMDSPKIEHTINYKNALGNERTIKLNSLNDFFMWR